MSKPPPHPSNAPPDAGGGAVGRADATSDEPATPAAASPALVRALRTLLRPLIRLLIARQVTYPEFAQLLKGLYVDVALRDVPVPSGRQTDSRLSLMTGVHRKDIRRLSAEDAAPQPVLPQVSLGGRLVARWSADAAYLDEEGHPRALPRAAADPAVPSFERLVMAESTDIRPRAVLDEWLRLGLVTLDEDGLIHLRRGGFVPSAGQDEQMYFFGRNLRDHMATATRNVMGEQPSRMERSVYASSLTPEAVQELAGMAESLGMDLLRALNRRARELQASADAQGQVGTERMALGLYFHTEGNEPDEGSNPPR